MTFHDLAGVETMSASEPLLVYNRIDANRRNTLLLLPVFAALLLPLAYGATQHIVPVFFYLSHVTLGRAQALLDVASTEARTLRIVLLAFTFTSCIAFLGYVSSTFFLLWHVGARRADRRKEQGLWRAVENLCLGAGLPQPAVYIVESDAPNAFSTGSDPGHASLVVTRGLLELLDERELRGVLAHELSHIGNRDTDLSNLLAALVATLRLPLEGLKGFVAFISDGDVIGVMVFGCGLVLLMFAETVVVWSLWARHVSGLPLNIREVMTLAAPVYALFIAPVVGMVVRKTILHQREFLADADAVLLTRDPEGLALALAKVDGAAGVSASALVATAHLYFVDPLARTESWSDSVFPSHPPVAERIALLARMGDGIPGRTLSEATAAGVEYADSMSPCTQARESGAYEPGARLRLTDSRTLLNKSAEGSSAVLADLDANLLVTVVDLEGHFVRVRLVDGVAGYIPLSSGLKRSGGEQGDLTGGVIHYRLKPAAAFDERSVPGTQFRLTDENTPLYAKPDGWSDVVQQLSSGAIVTLHDLVGNFARVTTDRGVGYIPRASGADSISPT